VLRRRLPRLTPYCWRNSLWSQMRNLGTSSRLQEQTGIVFTFDRQIPRVRVNTHTSISSTPDRCPGTTM
jgi:hypothetical protein